MKRRTQIYLDIEATRKLQKMATDQGESLSNLIRLAIREFLSRNYIIKDKERR